MEIDGGSVIGRVSHAYRDSRLLYLFNVCLYTLGTTFLDRMMQ